MRYRMGDHPFESEEWYDVEVRKARVGYVSSATVHSGSVGGIESEIRSPTTRFWRPTYDAALSRARGYAKRSLRKTAKVWAPRDEPLHQEVVK